MVDFSDKLKELMGTYVEGVKERVSNPLQTVATALKESLPTEENPTGGFGIGAIGSIAPKMFAKGFSESKKLGDYTIKARHVEAGEGSHGQLNVEIFTKSGDRVSSAAVKPQQPYDPLELTDAIVSNIATESTHRGKGLATEIYRYVSELGADIVPSSLRTKGGQSLWTKMEAEGLAKEGRIEAK